MNVLDETFTITQIKWFNIGGIYFNISMNLLANHRYSLLERLASYNSKNNGSFSLLYRDFFSRLIIFHF
jgi:hypothetical protein